MAETVRDGLSVRVRDEVAKQPQIQEFSPCPAGLDGSAREDMGEGRGERGVGGEQFDNSCNVEAMSCGGQT
jgi:hypothetical protein